MTLIFRKRAVPKVPPYRTCRKCSLGNRTKQPLKGRARYKHQCYSVGQSERLGRGKGLETYLICSHRQSRTENKYLFKKNPKPKKFTKLGCNL